MLKKINENQYDNASGLKKKGSSELTRLPTTLDKCRQYHQAMGKLKISGHPKELNDFNFN